MLPSFQSWFFEQRKRSLLPSSCAPFPGLAAGSTAWALETTGRSAEGHLCLWPRPCQEPSPEKLIEEKTAGTGWHHYCFHFLPKSLSKKATVPNPNRLSAKCQSRDRVEVPHLGADLQMWTGARKQNWALPSEFYLLMLQTPKTEM